MKSREKLIEQANNIRQTERKIVLLKLKKAKSKNSRSNFRIEESIRIHKIIRQELIDAYWSDA